MYLFSDSGLNAPTVPDSRIGWKPMDITPGWALFMFFVLGWAYYMVARILMEGSIFNGMRRSVKQRAERSWFFGKVDEMLGCLMCTATEASLWTLGTTTLVLGMHYHLPETVVSAAVGSAAHLSWLTELVLMAMASFALSVAVAGEAWTIKNIFEFNRQKYFNLQESSRLREKELLAKIRRLELQPEGNEIYEFDLITNGGE